MPSALHVVETDALPADETTLGMARPMRLVLPWPPSVLNPNRARDVHPVRRSVTGRNYQDAVYYRVKEATRCQKLDGEGLVYLGITFHPPTRARRDVDNAIGAFKKGQDGLALALGVDDSRFRYRPEPTLGATKPPLGCVVVEVEAP